MHILLITPAPAGSRSGNRTTAMRWRDMLRALGHAVDVNTAFSGQNADLMIALHAWRSADAVQAFAALRPRRPLIVAITGTDAYRYIHSHPQPTLQSIRLADALVGLHDLIADALPADQRAKMHVIYQSAADPAPRAPDAGGFRVSVIGHLRDEKDPLRPALAARLLSADSRIEIHQFGKAHDADWAAAATAEMASNPRYRWHGEVGPDAIRREYARTHLVVLPSRMEGGANVISEAVTAGAPVIASEIAGSVGLLGPDYPGYYPVGSESSLAALLQRAESDTGFLAALSARSAALRPRFDPLNEIRAWQALLAQVRQASPGAG